jgi:hypothetical protein
MKAGGDGNEEEKQPNKAKQQEDKELTKYHKQRQT